jgi:CHAD domain-containing protein
MAKGVPIHKLTKPDEPLRHSAPALIIRANEMLDWAAAAHDPACIAELHNMRIAAKRLRYTMEIFAPTLGPKADKLLKMVEDIQERLGAIHDCDVMIPLLEQALEKEINRERKIARRGDSPPPHVAAEGLIPLMQKKRAEREKRYREFIQFWDKLPPEKMMSDLIELASLPSDNEPINLTDGPENSAGNAAMDS